MNKTILAGIIAALAGSPTLHASDRYVSLAGGHVPPFTDWAGAATNIQDAIDVASAGETIWVTNGVYNTGGKVMYGDLTNRVALDKAVRVQSVNGASDTIIEGLWTTNGPAAVRCAWLTNGASLSGFTLQRGATRTSGDTTQLQSGGGVWCSDTNECLVEGCFIRYNSSANSGGGIFKGRVIGSLVKGNSTVKFGGGACYTWIESSAVIECQTDPTGVGGGVYGGALLNCTVVKNSAGSSAGGISVSRATNSIIILNSSGVGGSGLNPNYGGGSLTYCCTTPAAAGTGNTTTDPQLLDDLIHISAASPCRTNGLAIVNGRDIDGQLWADRRSIGCDEWQPEPLIPGELSLSPDAAVSTLKMTALAVGQQPFSCWWMKDGSILDGGSHYDVGLPCSLAILSPQPEDAGGYQLVVSNSFGVATSRALRLSFRCVNAANEAPTLPYSNWGSAAKNIQDAIDAAQPGEIVLVTNGVYRTGGKVMYGDLTNRVALDKAVTVQSVNGAFDTVIEGAWTTNGPSAVRCVWMTNGATLKGFTLQGGGTRNTGDNTLLRSGGGTWCSGTNESAVIACRIQNNSASHSGGGVFRGRVVGSLVVSNSADMQGGGACYSFLANSSIQYCSGIGVVGGGVYGGRLLNCTVTGNSSSYGGGGAALSFATNSILMYNIGGVSPNFGNMTMTYCCTTPAAPGTGNITADPELLADGIHISATSPCRTNGLAAASGTDFDGQPWTGRPSIGCDEWHPEPVSSKWSRIAFLPGRFEIRAVGAGQEPLAYYWVHDGVPVPESRFTGTQTSNLVCRNLQPEDGGAYGLVVSNELGVVTGAVARVNILCVDASAEAPQPPYLTWATASTNIQDAVDLATEGDLVLVNDGIYRSGGRVMAGDLTNRVAINKRITVQSAHGPLRTFIEGTGPTNGAAAVRCAWLAPGSALHGFTLRFGATRPLGAGTQVQSGGGAYCGTTNAVLRNCVLTDNASGTGGANADRIMILNSFLTGAQSSLGAAYGSILVNCTVTRNDTTGIYYCNATNCIIYNQAQNYSFNSLLVNCCTTPTPIWGSANITSDPQLLADNLHLNPGSPCAGAGLSAVVSGTDLDGQAWSNPPSMGCDQWGPEPVIMAQSGPQAIGTGFKVGIGLALLGQEPFTCWWTKDGMPMEDGGNYTAAHTPTLGISAFGPSDVGTYQAVVSNAFGMVTSEVVHVSARYVDAAGTQPVYPFTSSATAATNIQDAIEAAHAGDVIFVAEGVYGTGGKVLAGDLLNRVAIDKPVLVQSIDGPRLAAIRGAGYLNGASAVRCAWIGDGATLSGFTLAGGATRTTGNVTTLQCGGGVWCNSALATVFNCDIGGNTAADSGAGAYSGTLKSSFITLNFGAKNGGAAASSTLANCTATANWVQSYGGGVYLSTLNNSIVYSNRSTSVYGASNYYSSTFTYSCSSPLPAGTGNISADPQLLSDGLHLSSMSPCRFVGGGSTSGNDLDGQAWQNPPSIGCDQWFAQAQPVTVGPWQFANVPDTLGISGFVTGDPPIDCYWLRNGAPIESTDRVVANGPSLLIRRLLPEDAGSYSLVASNAVGMGTNTTKPLRIVCVDASSPQPSPPHSQWDTAASTIQDAIEAAQPGDYILATNGVYSAGGKIMSGDLFNRAAVDKPVTLLSVNGPTDTVIQGAWDPVATNGPQAVRALWLGPGAMVSGFTVRGGATRDSVAEAPSTMGGGIYADEASGIRNCSVISNAASTFGGGIYNGNATNCIIRGNLALQQGGGARSSIIVNSAIIENSAGGLAGGASSCNLIHCTISRNFAPQAGGIDISAAGNCIVSGNLSQVLGTENFIKSTGLYYSYSGDAPGLVDLWHLAANSPCRNAGIPLFTMGVDLDGQSWAGAPSAGCDEVYEADFVGPLAITVSSVQTEIAALAKLPLAATVTGRASQLDWDFGDVVVTNASWFIGHAWTNPGDYTVTVTAYNNDHPEGVSASLPIRVVPFQAPSMALVGQTTNKFTMSLATQWGVQYVVEQATNLAPPVTWRTVTNFIGVDGVQPLTDPYATNSARFYRVRVP